MSKFQIIFIGIFAVLMVGGLLVFSMVKGKSSNQAASVVVWGTLDSGTMGKLLTQINDPKTTNIQINYVQKNPVTFDRELLEAMAVGTGPDIITISQDAILAYQNRLLYIPYNNYPQVNFQTNFVQEGELFMFPQGIYAVPFALDPMVMYWNRDMLNNITMTQPPVYWGDVLKLPALLTQTTPSLSIERSAVALGEYTNIDHAKEILGTLLMQVGNPIYSMTSAGLVNSFDRNIDASEEVMKFYTQFADPTKQVYSWNKSLAGSKNNFIANRLAIYFGYASENTEIRGKNPNLNFSVALMPQIQSKDGAAPVKVTYGKMIGLAVTKSTQNSAAALGAIEIMTSKDAAAAWSTLTNLPSVRRDALVSDASQASSAIFATSALWSRGWLDPNPNKTSDIFKNLVEYVTSGQMSPRESVQEADSQLQILLGK